MSFTMKSMPFINQLQHWANVQPHQTAVAVGQQRISFAELQQEAIATAAMSRTAPQELPVTVIEEPNSVGLATQLCAAVIGEGIAAVLDSHWPLELRTQTRAAIRDWAATAEGASLPRVDRQNIDGAPGSTFLLGFSSGTSGVPKAFTRTRESWRISFEQSTSYFGLTPQDVTLAPGPLAASMNLYALGESLYSGSTFVALPSFSPDAALESIRHDAVTRLVLVPTVLSLIANRGLATGQGPGSVISIVCAGSALSGAVIEQVRQWAPAARIYQYYGAAELGFVTAGLVGEPDLESPESPQTPEMTAVGHSFPGVELAVLDPAGVAAQPGSIGDIYVHSPYVSQGYAWGDDGLAFNVLANSVLASGKEGRDGKGITTASWYTVHDQGFIDPSGILHVVGRASEMIVTSGANVYPQQVEKSLEDPLGNGTIVVTGIPDPQRGQRVVAGLVVTSGTVENFLSGCRQRATGLARHQCPSQYFLLSTLPVSSAGKISRALLRDWICEGDSRAQRIF